MKLPARKIVIHVLVPLLAGMLIYVLSRKNTWLHQHYLPDDIALPIDSSNWFGYFVQYNLPDFCWDYSLASALFLAIGKTGKYTPVSVLLLLLTAEGIQYFFPQQFTFDWLDMVAALPAFFLSYRANATHEEH